MSNIQIPNLPAAVSLNGSEQFEGVQAGVSTRITAAQLAAYMLSQYPPLTLRPLVIAQQIVETVVDAPIVAGVLTIDLTQGSIFRTVIDANITSIVITGVVANYVNSFTWKTVADGNSYSQTWSSVPILWPSSAAPVLTTTLNAVDWYSFMLENGDWYGFVAGQNY